MTEPFEFMEQHKRRLRSAGYKVTQARLSVLRALQELDGHVTSSDLLDKVAQIDDSVGRASVFRTLDLLTELGIVRPTYIGTSMTPTYVMMPGGHHHHVICTNCNRVLEFEDCGLSSLQDELERRLDVQISGHLLEFYGLCQQCTLDTETTD